MSKPVFAPTHLGHIKAAFSQLGQLDGDLDLHKVLQAWAFGSEHPLCRPYKTVERFVRQYRRWLCAESCLYRDRIESHRDEPVDPNTIGWKNPVPYPAGELALAMPHGVRHELLLCVQHLLYRTMVKNNRGGHSNGPVYDFWYIRHLVHDFARSLRQDHCGKTRTAYQRGWYEHDLSMTIVHPGEKWLEDTKYDTQTNTWPHLVYRTGAEYIRNTFNMHDSDLDDADLAYLKRQGIEP